ncbi:hypothetical protein FDK38_001317 [Candidozyma auris]|nr:hypothetical protein FDK38_001317 [[Candida] auris]
MQFSTVVVALTAATAVSAANASNGSNSSNGSNGSGKPPSSGAAQAYGAGALGVAAAAGVAMLFCPTSQAGGQAGRPFSNSHPLITCSVRGVTATVTFCNLPTFAHTQYSIIATDGLRSLGKS